MKKLPDNISFHQVSPYLFTFSQGALMKIMRDVGAEIDKGPKTGKLSNVKHQKLEKPVEFCTRYGLSGN